MAWNPHDGWRDEWRDAGHGFDWQPEDELPRRPVQHRPRIGLFIVALLAIMFVYEALSTPFTPDDRFNLRVEGPVAYAYGGTDSESFADVLEQLNANPQLETIVLRNVAGTTDLRVNSRIAELIRARGIDTHLERTSYIASGGVDLFLAGEERSMECGARIGVHSWASEDGSEPRTLGYDPLEDRMEAFHDRLGVADGFYSFARDAAPHSSLYFLTTDDIATYDLLGDGASCERAGFFGLFR